MVVESRGVIGPTRSVDRPAAFQTPTQKRQGLSQSITNVTPAQMRAALEDSLEEDTISDL